MHVPNNRVLKRIRQKLIELQETDEFTVTGRDFNTSLSELDRSSKQKISKNITELNNTLINNMDITDIYKLFHPHFSQAHLEYSLRKTMSEFLKHTSTNLK